MCVCVALRPPELAGIPDHLRVIKTQLLFPAEEENKHGWSIKENIHQGISLPNFRIKENNSFFKLLFTSNV